MTPDRRILLEILEVATRIPSGDNCQPWYFRSHPERLEILHDESRGAHALNRNNHASLISLGCLIEAFSLASSAHGLATQVTTTFETEPPSSAGPWATVTFTPSTEQPHPLASTIKQRATDRRSYRGGDMNSAVYQQMAEDAKKFPHVRYCQLPQAQCSTELLQTLSLTENCVWNDEIAHGDLMRWIRFSDKEVWATKDGMPWKTLGITYPESRVLKLCRSFGTQQLMNKAGFISQSQKVTVKQVRSSAGLVLWTTEKPSAWALFSVGRLALRAWLRLTAHGYAAQPMTLSSLSLYDRATGSVKAQDPAYALLHDSLSVIQGAFSLSSQQLPVWMLRTGISDPLPPEKQCLRLDVEGLLR